MSTTTISIAHKLLAITVLGSLSACGGSSSDDAPGETPGVSSPLIIGTGSGNSASETSTSEIQAKALSGATQVLSVNLGNLQRLNDDSNTLNTGPIGLDGTTDEPLFTELDTSTDTFLRKSLGLDDPLATVIRDGDVITIDPDENRLCEEPVPLVGEASEDPDVCRQLMAEVKVEIAAATEDTGVIIWLFQDAPVLLIGYAPNASSYELDLAGLERVQQQAYNLYNLESPSPVTIAGRVRLESRLTNDTAGAEAGNISLAVVQAIVLNDADSGTGIKLEPSTVLELSADAATGEASLRVDWGALTATSDTGDSEGNTSLQTIALGGLTGQLNVSGEDQTLSITNLGIGDVPMILTVNSIQTVSAEFDTVNLSVDNQSGALVIDGVLGVRLALNNLAGLFEEFGPEFIADLDISAPAGTAFLEQFNGSTKVTAGGPFNASYSATDNTQSVQQSLSIGAGACFGEADDTVDALVEKPCD